METETKLVSGFLERISEAGSNSVFRDYTGEDNFEEHKDNLPVANHSEGLKIIFSYLQRKDYAKWLDAIGHRVVHGEAYQAPVHIDQAVINSIREMVSLAPLHNLANLAGIEAAHDLYPEIPQLAVFDTAFFRTLPAYAYRYALPDELYRQHHVRRYGFHGISHQYVSRQAASFLQQPLKSLRLITLHLGNGASAAAIKAGTCIDTSMGLTPLEGLIMGTRCGDLDPSVHFYLNRKLGLNFNEIETLLNHKSGTKGLCGAKDMREVHHLASTGNEQARLAIEMMCYRIAKYVGAYYITLDGLDALIFTAGIGENDQLIRQTVCDKLSVLGIKLDLQRNRISDSNQAFQISSEQSTIKVLVVPTNEELEIARETVSHINKTDTYC